MLFDGRVLSVTMLVKVLRNAETSNPLYTVEAVEIDAPASWAPETGIEPTHRADSVGPVGPAGDTESVSQWLETVKRAVETNSLSDPKFSMARNGSPHTFDTFLAEHIGKGEGAQTAMETREKKQGDRSRASMTSDISKRCLRTRTNLRLLLEAHVVWCFAC
jgi:hypothetical protein